MESYGFEAKNGARANQLSLIWNLRDYLKDFPTDTHDDETLDVITNVIIDVAFGLHSMKAIASAMKDVDEYGQLPRPNFDNIVKFARGDKDK